MNISLSMFARLREEAPLYYNAEHDFYALSRYDWRQTGRHRPADLHLRAGRAAGIIKSGMEIPGALIFEDPPIHNIHHNLLGAVHPAKVAALEPQIRSSPGGAWTLVSSGRFDFVNDLSEQMPMRVIGMLLEDPGGPAAPDHRPRRGNLQKEGRLAGHRRVFAEFIDWRAEHRPTTS